MALRHRVSELRRVVCLSFFRTELISLAFLRGAITLSIGLFAAVWFPASPTQTAGGIRGKGWFSEREESEFDPTRSLRLRIADVSFFLLRSHHGQSSHPRRSFQGSDAQPTSSFVD